MVQQDAGTQGHGVPGGDGAVGPDLQGQLVVVGGVSHAGVLHGVVDLAHRGVHRVHGNDADDRLSVLVPVGGDVATALGQGQLHVQSGIGAQSGDVMLRVENLHIAVGLDVTSRHDPLTGGLDIDGFDPFAVQLGDDALDVQNDLGHVLLHPGDGGELVLDAGDFHRGHCGAGQRGQKNAAQGVANGGAVAPLQRLYDILAVGLLTHVFDALNARLLNFYHIVNTLLLLWRSFQNGCELLELRVTITWSTTPRSG